MNDMSEPTTAAVTSDLFSSSNVSPAQEREVAISPPPILGLRSVATIGAGVIAALFLISIAQRSTRVIGWVVAASIGATLLAAVISFFERRVGHRVSVLLTTLALFGFGGFLLFRVVGELRAEISNLQRDVPGAAARLERSDGFGRVLREFGLSEKADSFMKALPNHLAGETPGQVARTAGTRGAAFIAGLVLACFLCAGARRSFGTTVSWFPERKGHLLNRHSVTQIAERAHRRLSVAVLFSVLKGCAVGTVVGIVLWLGGVPGPTVLGLMFGLASMVPGVGVLVAGIVSAALVLGVVDGRDRWFCLLGLSGAIALDRFLQRRAVRKGMLDVGPAVATAAFFGGFELGGIGTALCLLAIAAYAGTLWAEFERVRSFWQPDVRQDVRQREVREAVRPEDADGSATVVVSPGTKAEVSVGSAFGRLFLYTTALVTLARGGLGLLRAMRQTWVLVIIAVVIALALERIAGPLAARLRGNRHAAVGVVCAGVIAVLTIGTLLLTPVISSRARSFGTELPEMTKRLESLPVVGERLQTADTPAAVERWLTALPRNLGRNSSRITNALGGAADMIVMIVILVILSLSLVVDGPRLVGSVRKILPPVRRRLFDQASKLVVEVVGRYFAGSLLVALLAGLVSLTVGLALGIVLAPVVALWIALTNLIPQVGGFLGGVVFVAFGFATSSTAGLICIVYFLTYQQIENQLIQPAVIGKAVAMSPAATTVIVLIGGSALGVPGAMISVPIVGAVKIVLRHLLGGSDRQPEGHGSLSAVEKARAKATALMKGNRRPADTN